MRLGAPASYVGLRPVEALFLSSRTKPPGGSVDKVFVNEEEFGLSV